MPKVERPRNEYQALEVGGLTGPPVQSGLARVKAEQSLGEAYAESLKSVKNVADTVLRIRAEEIGMEEETSPEGYVSSYNTFDRKSRFEDLDSYQERGKKERDRLAERLRRKLGVNPFGKEVMDKFSRWSATKQAQSEAWYNSTVLQRSRTALSLENKKAVRETAISGSADEATRSFARNSDQILAKVGITLDREEAQTMINNLRYSMAFSGSKTAAFSAGARGLDYKKAKAAWGGFRKGLDDDTARRAFDDAFAQNYARGIDKRQDPKSVSDTKLADAQFKRIVNIVDNAETQAKKMRDEGAPKEEVDLFLESARDFVDSQFSAMRREFPVSQAGKFSWDTVSRFRGESAYIARVNDLEDRGMLTRRRLNEVLSEARAFSSRGEYAKIEKFLEDKFDVSITGRVFDPPKGHVTSMETYQTGIVDTLSENAKGRLDQVGKRASAPNRIKIDRVAKILEGRNMSKALARERAYAYYGAFSSQAELDKLPSWGNASADMNRALNSFATSFVRSERQKHLVSLSQTSGVDVLQEISKRATEEPQLVAQVISIIKGAEDKSYVDYFSLDSPVLASPGQKLESVGSKLGISSQELRFKFLDYLNYHRKAKIASEVSRILSAIRFRADLEKEKEIRDILVPPDADERKR